jgi:Cys-tRNA(Pro) deacylase
MDEQGLKTILQEAGVRGDLIRLDVETPTVERAAEALGVAPDEIIKSLLFQCRGGECVLVIARGTARVDPKKLAAVTGKDGWRLAKPEVVLRVTGYPAGGTPPVGHAEKLRVLMDRRAAAADVVYGGAGTRSAMLRIRIADIRRLTGAEVHDLVSGESGVGS